MGESQVLISTERLYKVFGPRPERALALLDEGLDRDEIFRRSGHTLSVQDVSFEVSRGEIFVVMGLSGSGKSTLLRLLNRLIEPTSGVIRIGGRDITKLSSKELIDLRRRDVSMVFQSFALMPHLSVADNVAFGLHVSGLSRRERSEKARAALALVGLEAHADVSPDALSGGMQQRVGLARALAAEPTVLLMDEAFSALDPLIRSEMQDELLQLQQARGLTIVFITHDLDEAMKVGDRIAILEGGRLLQVGSAEEILQHPADEHVRSFFGGVDVTRVLTARELARSEPVVLDARKGGLHGALNALRRHGRDFGYVCGAGHRFLGVVTVDGLLDALERGAARVTDAMTGLEPVPATAAFETVVGRLTEAPCPLPVVDEQGRLLGTISKTHLLQSWQRGLG